MEFLLRRIITISFIALFTITPLLLTPYNYELFEFNKTLFLYTMTVAISAAWLIRSVWTRYLTIPLTPLTIPLMAFFATQLVATLLSISLEKNKIVKSILYSVLFIILTITLLYTKSRSGFIAAYAGMGVFWLLSVIPVFQKRISNKLRRAVFSSIGIQLVLLVMLTFLIGSPFPQINASMR